MKENKMGTMPVKQLIISMSLPMMISMLMGAGWKDQRPSGGRREVS